MPRRGVRQNTGLALSNCSARAIPLLSQDVSEKGLNESKAATTDIAIPVAAIANPSRARTRDPMGMASMTSPAIVAAVFQRESDTISP